MEELKAQLNGFGVRLNKVVETIGRHDERIQDNKETIIEVRNNVKEIQTSINWAVFKVILIVAIPTLLVLYQLINK